MSSYHSWSAAGEVGGVQESRACAEAVKVVNLAGSRRSEWVSAI